MAKTFDFKKVIVTVGPVIINGFADGDDAIVVEKVSPLYSSRVGGDGEFVRSKSPDKRGKITLRLLASSFSNSLLSGLAALDELGTGQGDQLVLIKDMNSIDLVIGENCYVTELPKMAYGRTVGERIWVLESPNLILFSGGMI